MKRAIAEWAWRIAVLALLGAIAGELHMLRDDLSQVSPDASTGSASADDLQESLDALRDDIADVKQQVNAIMSVMSRAK